MLARDFAKRPVVTSTPDASIREVASIMSSRRIGLVVIVDRRNPELVVGVVSERDIIRAVAQGLDLGKPVEEVMSAPAIAVEAEEPVWRVAEIMQRHGIRHVVVTRGGRLYGVISIRDLLAERAALKTLAEHAREIF